jgi:hypothetical protein
MINEAKADHNAHTHTGTGVAPAGGHLIATTDLVAWNNLFEISVCCTAMGALGDYLSTLKTFLDEVKTDHNAHTHAAADAAPDGVAIAAGLPSIDATQAEDIDRQCPALNGPNAGASLGAIMQQIVTLATEFKTDWNAHEHPTAMTNPPSGHQVAASDVDTIS